MPHPRLYIPGPTEVANEVMAAQMRPLSGHRSAEFAELFYRVAAGMKQILCTNQHLYITASSGSGLHEAAIRNTVRPGRKVLNMVSGAFGDRWHKVSIANGIESVRVDLPWGQPVRPEDVDAALSTGEFDAVTVVHNETSTAVISDIEAIAAVLTRNHPQVLLLIDAVSSAGGVQILFDEWGIDLLLTASQKALALPPGLAFVAVRERVLARAEEVPYRGWYFDLLLLERYFSQGRTTPATPAISLLNAADCQVERIFAEGLKARWARHQSCMEMTHAWARQHGFSLFAAPSYASPTVTCIKNNLQIDVPAMLAYARTHNLIVGNGYGKIKNQTYRIAHMGELNQNDMKDLFHVLDGYSQMSSIIND